MEEYEALANLDAYGGETFGDGVKRQRTVCKILVHSHIVNEKSGQSGEYDLTPDVIQCEVQKTIKGGGSANFTLVPRLNYINYIFPNDYVNIYFAPGDARGYIRTFFGFVDSITRNVSTDQSGATTTRYQVACSDFTKAFDTIQVYFNPQLENRPDLVDGFAATNNLGGVAMRTKGVTTTGSPADLVMNLLHLSCSFGAQFILPPKYAKKAAKIIKLNRASRVKWAQDQVKIPKDAEEHIKGKAFTELEKELEKDIEARVEKNVTSKNKEKRKKQIEAIKKKVYEERGLPIDFFLKQAVVAAKTVEESASEAAQKHLLDLIDFTHIEHKSIDGFIASRGVWYNEGSVWSIVNSWSNDVVNELFCDLRPTQDGVGLDRPVMEGDYSFEDDELAGNQGDGDALPAVRYVPAVVMREYPFSTIYKFQVPDTLRLYKDEKDEAGRPIGVLYFGGIFARNPNVAGRAVVEMPAINDSLLAKHKGKHSSEMCFKSLDVFTLHVQDIISESISRTDADVCNLIEVYAEVSSGSHQKSARFLTREILPVINAGSIARHGLRVRRHDAKCARFGAHAILGDGTIDSTPSRKMIIRWSLLLDHWHQHNIEYLRGTFTTRALPELRVGYRLDIFERAESYYVEGVNHSWTYPDPMTTTITVSRGQRNDPFPVSVRPMSRAMEGLRDQKSRLCQFFYQTDPAAVARAVIFDDSGEYRWGINTLKNYTDRIDGNPNEWAKTKAGYDLPHSDDYNFAAIEAAAEQLKLLKRTQGGPKDEEGNYTREEDKQKDFSSGDSGGSVS